MWAQFKPTILFVTHDVREAVLLGDRVLVFSSRPGTIKREIIPDLPRPRNETSEGFIRIQAELLEFLEKSRVSQNSVS